MKAAITSIPFLHLVGTGEIAQAWQTNATLTSTILDVELTTLATMATTTASIFAHQVRYPWIGSGGAGFRSLFPVIYPVYG